MDPSDQDFGSFLATYDDNDTDNVIQRSAVNPNNPYRQSQFMSFPAQGEQRQGSAIRRRQTQTRPVNVQDFEQAFQTERKSNLHLGGSQDSSRLSAFQDIDEHSANSIHSPGSPPFLTRHVSFSRLPSLRNPSVSSFSAISTGDREDTLDDSDTARLTTNVAGSMPIQPPSPVHYPQTPNYVESNPFGRTDSQSVPTVHHSRSLQGISNMIRRVSTRVVNLQNRRSITDAEEDRMLQQEPLTELLSPSERGKFDDDIEMTPVADRDRHNTPDYDYSKDKKSAQSLASEASQPQSQIILAGKSCNIFGPDNWLRVSLARILAWRYVL